jgi:hypothetical protein
MLCVHSQNSRNCSFGPKLRNSGSWSVLVVPPDFDGLLRSTPCRFVAPCNRPWGSPRFRLVPGLGPKTATGGLPSPTAQHPSKRFPLQQLYSCHHEPLPSRRCSWLCHPVRLRGSTEVVLRWFSKRRYRSLGLKALLRCKVRCVYSTFPLNSCSMLPWASASATARLIPHCPCRLSEECWLRRALYQPFRRTVD